MRWLLRTLMLAVAAALLCTAPIHAQTPVGADEISFWESVRDSKNPAELQAYIDTYPNGRFVVLAKARLAGLAQKPATPSSPARAAPPLIAGEKHTPQAGDTWTYRLTYPRLRGQWGQPTRPPQQHMVRASEVTQGGVVDALSIDGGPPVSLTHAGRQLVTQGAAIFSPYLSFFDPLPANTRLGSLDSTCPVEYICEAKARVAGEEEVTVPAGRFLAKKVIVDQEWRATAGIRDASRMTGGRTLTVWYAPVVGRAVKYSSRLTVGDVPPIDANFDLELVSYQVK